MNGNMASPPAGSWRRDIVRMLLRFSSVLLAILLFAWFCNENYNRIVRQNINYIESCTVQEAKQFEQSMDDALTIVRNTAGWFAMLVELEEDTTVPKKLETIQSNSLFEQLIYISPDGTGITMFGSVDVSDREYFRRGMQGESGWDVGVSRITGEYSLLFYAPVWTNGKVAGVIGGVYTGDKIRMLLTSEVFGYTPRTFLLRQDGTLVVGSDELKASGNMRERFENEEFSSDMSYSRLLAFLEDPDQRAISFSYGNSSDTREAAIAKSSDGKWLLMNVVPSRVTAGMLDKANQTGLILVIVLAMMYIVNMVVTIVTARGQEKALRNAVDSATMDLQETLADERRNVAIIQSLSSIYSSVCYCSLRRMYYKMLQNRDGENALFGEKAQAPNEGDLRDAVRLYVDQGVMPSYAAEVSRFLELSTLPERLQTTSAIGLEYQRADGAWVRGTIVVSDRDEKGGIRSALFAIQNIQGEKDMELQTQAALHDAYDAAQMANRAKTTFLSSMSHDMRTPMNAIIGMTAIAASHLDDRERVRECLEKITASGRHLLSLINEVLDMSKIESGKVDLEEEEFSLSELVERMLILNHSLLVEHNHMLDIQLRSLVHENVVGDQVRLQQVFTNLLSNAAKYTPDNGHIRIELTEQQTHSANTGWYRIVFEDNGIGMSEEFQKQIFEPFSRASGQASKTQGTGLGMSIARNIIRMMGGDITVESELGKGTKFTVTFCLKLQNEAPEEDATLLADLPVLVADDDPVACETSCEMLTGLGMRREWVLSGEEAVEKVRARHDAGDDYYAVILDWRMPGIGGLGAARAIREMVGDQLPVVVFSAYDWSDIEEEATAAGVNAFVGKPLFRSRVLSLFHELHGRQPEKAPQTLQSVMERLSFSGKRVLLAEDNEINAEIAMEILEMAQLMVDRVPNGREAVQKVAMSEQGYYDLIFMDIQMPVMDGYEATRAIRSLPRPDVRTLPIVAMTANAFSSDIQNARDAGMDDHVAKPLDFDHLTKVLKRYLQNT